MKKRDFLKFMSMLAVPMTPAYSILENAMEPFLSLSPAALASTEDFWEKIRAGYDLKSEYINLENGYYCHMPEQTLEHLIQNIRYVNKEASFYMRNHQWEREKEVRGQLADLLGVSVDELIITRNTTESLDTVISGFPWQKGDEAIMAKQDYGAMRNQFFMMEDRHGIKVKEVSVPDHPGSDQEIVDVYASAITPKTRLLMVCHMINITGHILPIKKICDMAHERGVEVLVDGAHTVGHIRFNIADLGCDYFGSSLHKWLSVPLGAGILYVQKDKIAKISPLFSDGPTENNNLKKLNHKGTHPVHTHLTIPDAISYYKAIGADRKEERLRYLQRYWSDQVRDHERIIVNTPREKHRSCAIANVGIKDMPPSDLAKTLLDKYGIWTVAINGPVYGCRITPNVYTLTSELDHFVSALKEIADS